MIAHYKVVFRRGGGNMFSAIMESCGVEYKIGEWARPNKGCGPLCVFDSLGGAREFLNQRLSGCPDRYYCFQCSIEPSKHKAAWSALSISIGDLPAGTVLADAVKLEKEPINLYTTP